MLCKKCNKEIDENAEQYEIIEKRYNTNKKLLSIIIISIICLLLVVLFFIRQIPRCAMRGFCQGMEVYYKVVDLQDYAKRHNKMFSQNCTKLK